MSWNCFASEIVESMGYVWSASGNEWLVDWHCDGFFLLLFLHQLVSCLFNLMNPWSILHFQQIIYFSSFFFEFVSCANDLWISFVEENAIKPNESISINRTIFEIPNIRMKGCLHIWWDSHTHRYSIDFHFFFVFSSNAWTVSSSAFFFSQYILVFVGICNTRLTKECCLLKGKKKEKEYSKFTKFGLSILPFFRCCWQNLKQKKKTWTTFI